MCGSASVESMVRSRGLEITTAGTRVPIMTKVLAIRDVSALRLHYCGPGAAGAVTGRGVLEAWTLAGIPAERCS
jgi:hypothetical protein